MSKLKDSSFLVILIDLLIFTIVAITLTLPYGGSLALLVAIILSLLYAEKKGYINWVFSLFIRHKKVAMWTTVIGLLILPFVLSGNRYVLHIAVLCCIYGMVALGLNFQMGSTDMTNFASAAFFGIGAYTTAVVSVKYGLSPWLGFILAIFVAVALVYYWRSYFAYQGLLFVLGYDGTAVDFYDDNC